MIKVENLSKKFKQRLVLKNISLTIENNERIAFMGLNGAGKTTFCECIIGLTEPTEGTIKFSEFDEVRKNAIFQEMNFDNELSLNAILTFYKDAFKAKKTSESNDEMLKKFGLLKLKHNKYQRLSGGQKQKFKFLVSLINKPNVLLLDELSTALDFVWREKIVLLIKRYLEEQDCTLLLISHNPEEVAELCTRLIVINDGQIMRDVKVPKEKMRALKIITEIGNEILKNDSDI